MNRPLAAMTTVMTAAVAASLLSFGAWAQSGEDDLLERVRSGEVGQRADQTQQLRRYDSASQAERQRMLEAARARRDALQADSAGLEETARGNERVLETKIGALRTELGPNAALFGTLQGISSELIGVFRNSSTSLQYPNRDAWLSDFIERMEKSSEIFTIDELEQLWFLMQQEITASGKIASLRAEVLGESGARETRELVRLGKFGLITRDPAPAYLTWDTNSQRASLLKRQPEGDALYKIDDYLTNTRGVASVAIDPTAGSLLSRLVDAPGLRDRIAAGGLIGNLILTLGAVGVAIAVFKLISIMIVSAKVARQRADIQHPRANNPLGRMLQIYEDNKEQDTETLEMRLGEAILEERPKIDRFVGTIKVISAVAPLMGLMGTVIGMIATFQAITLFGTGDPKTMAGGISQALVTTVEGLTVAIPTVLLHAVVNARATALINTLKHQTAGLIAERMEARAERRAA
ncbi:MotA/TolQ/ExbB proton channel family protein [Abyssibacter sp.]|uniref:MotA/TolQ/ExbB proton channel family protein n=2 Tax=Abyssibacter sp. TaxID=2320200 RepID=UPI0035A3A642